MLALGPSGVGRHPVVAGAGAYLMIRCSLSVPPRGRLRERIRARGSTPMIMLGIVATTRPAQLDVPAIYMNVAHASPKAAVPHAIIGNGRLARMSVSIANVPARLEPFTIIG